MRAIQVFVRAVHTVLAGLILSGWPSGFLCLGSVSGVGMAVPIWRYRVGVFLIRF